MPFIVIGILAVVIIAVVVYRSQASLTWKTTVFRRGDRVRIRKWAGTKKPEDTGHSKEVDSGPGQTGTILKKVRRPSGDTWLILVNWDGQEWREYNSGGKKVRLPQLTATIHPDYLEHLDSKPLQPQRLEAEGKIFVEGQSVRLNKRTYFSPEKCGHPQGVYGSIGQTAVFFRGDLDDRAVVDWSAQEWQEDETEKIIRLPAFTCDLLPRGLDVCS